MKLDPNDDFIEMETVLTNQKNLVEQLGGISEGEVINLTVVESFLRNIRFGRQERNLPSLPINIATIPALPNDFQTTASGNQFF